MPIYKYKCEKCEEHSTFMHASSEVRTDCEKCESKNSLVKLLGNPTIKKGNTIADKDSSVGELTKKFIEENREILNQQKKQYSKKQYDKS